MPDVTIWIQHRIGCCRGWVIRGRRRDESQHCGCSPDYRRRQRMYRDVGGRTRWCGSGCWWRSVGGGMPGKCPTQRHGRHSDGLAWSRSCCRAGAHCPAASVGRTRSGGCSRSGRRAGVGHGGWLWRQGRPDSSSGGWSARVGSTDSAWSWQLTAQPICGPGEVRRTCVKPCGTTILDVAPAPAIPGSPAASWTYPPNNRPAVFCAARRGPADHGSHLVAVRR
jgi:hypothetical protein